MSSNQLRSGMAALHDLMDNCAEYAAHLCRCQAIRHRTVQPILCDLRAALPLGGYSSANRV
jgi:hypothetical protein